MTTHHDPSPAPRPPGLRPRSSAAAVLPLLLAALAMAGVAAACAGGAGAGASLGTAAAADSGQELRHPIEIESVRGVLDVRLEATVRQLVIPGPTPRSFPMRTYRLLWANGVSYADSNKYGFPGPTFKVTQGDSVRILLVNNLPRDTAGCVNYPASRQRGDTVPFDTLVNCFHGPNSTNIHYHGFHVSPVGAADNVLMQIRPGQTFQYAFRIPANQSAGTHWYHPHKHGSVAQQVTNGMSGAFIIKARNGGLDSLTRARDIREVLVAVQEIDPNLNLVDNTIPRAKLVNGQYKPVIPMAAGEVIRLRLVNENIAASASYSLLFQNKPGEEPSLYDIARDGVQYAPVNYDTITPDTKLWVAPGNRLDVFMRAPCTAGLHELEAAVSRPNQEDSRKAEEGAPLNAVQTVLRVQVAAPAGGRCTLTQLPPTLPPLPGFLGNLTGSMDTTTMPVIVFSDSFPPRPPRSQGYPARFWLGSVQNPYMRMSDRVFIPTSSRGARLPMVLGQTQTWKVVNRGTSANHPFHIHINPFQVVSVAYGASDPNAGYYAILNNASQQNRAPVWLDVLPLPVPYVNSAGVTVPGYAIIRQRYDPFVNADGSVCRGCGPPVGQFVTHCHILGHEERGMMQILEIFPTLADANASSGLVRAPLGPIAPASGSGAHRH
ncbi:MAG TPA: multicopper oxidase family protein [Longimicrobium sp.]|nr:multicopper oxidase family protein [Longimicrobium sp.]